jgi:nicotinate-nucleotide adenylyltransferase
VAAEVGFAVSDIEIQRSGPSYTIDTLRHFTAMEPEGLELFFIVGLDAFLEIHTWKSYRDMFQLAAFIVMARPQSHGSAMPWQASVVEYVQHWISQDYALCPSGDILIHPQREPIYLAWVTPILISSSQIREMIRQGRSIQNWVAPPVAGYIERKGLYR